MTYPDTWLESRCESGCGSVVVTVATAQGLLHVHADRSCYDHAHDVLVNEGVRATARAWDDPGDEIWWNLQAIVTLAQDALVQAPTPPH
jgi:hypothetical protein